MNPHNKRTVFLLHDHALVREWLARLIDLQGDLSVCGEADDSTEAFVEMAGLRPDITVVDSQMLNKSTTSVIGEITRVAPLTKVVVLSAMDSEYDAREARLDGASGYTSRSTQIVAAIRRVLGGELFVGDDSDEPVLMSA